MSKLQLREKYTLLRQSITHQERENLSLSIANQVLKLPIWEHLFYHIFLAIEEKKEINTDYILNILSGKDKNVLISKSHFKTGDMSHFLLTDNTIIKKNKYHIPEPVDGIEITEDKIEVVFIPLLAFDEQGNRVGYGKGFYDRFLAKCKPTAIKVGLSFFKAETDNIDVFESDVKLDYCVTPDHIYRF
ncbi:5-formyltetrahydrofolate cyclo-ligase [Changchengzhania lutea]|uniref:5-formyltetrahydrofolate cyclo-ligase n=1 Tax=Changchengzhania lutea TaxID=2049305 RepID=UPI00115C9DCF|nr:5-formyltetrahydrofolate cyclo-ligase [Changchengzhania lutea]